MHLVFSFHWRCEVGGFGCLEQLKNSRGLEILKSCVFHHHFSPNYHQMASTTLMAWYGARVVFKGRTSAAENPLNRPQIQQIQQQLQLQQHQTAAASIATTSNNNSYFNPPYGLEPSESESSAHEASWQRIVKAG